MVPGTGRDCHRGATAGVHRSRRGYGPADPSAGGYGVGSRGARQCVNCPAEIDPRLGNGNLAVGDVITIINQITSDLSRSQKGAGLGLGRLLQYCRRTCGIGAGSRGTAKG